jgi:hypothetical protein
MKMRIRRNGMEPNKIGSKRNYGKLLLAVLLLAISVLGIIGMFRFGSILAFLWIFPFFVDKLVDVTGMNNWLAWALAVPATIAAISILGLLFSWKKDKRQKGFAIACAAIFVFSLLMFAIEKDYPFDKDGKATQCYASTPNGYEIVPCSWKVHRMYGTEVKPVSKDMAMTLWTKKNGIPTVQRIEPKEDLAFFAPDGTPLVWYYQYPDGKIELFQHPGAHPQLGSQVILSPVSPGIIIALKKLQDENRRNMIAFNTTATQNSETAGAQVRNQETPPATRQASKEKSELEKLVDTLGNIKFRK